MKQFNYTSHKVMYNNFKMKHTITFENTPKGLVIEYSKDIPIPELWTLLHSTMKMLKLTEKQCLQIFNLDKIVQENAVASNN